MFGVSHFDVRAALSGPNWRFRNLRTYLKASHVKEDLLTLSFRWKAAPF
tara:strand:+ start:228 stop:374 length:147 start_codon:yes stop_codon:yes gene_type:complete